MKTTWCCWKLRKKSLSGAWVGIICQTTISKVKNDMSRLTFWDIPTSVHVPVFPSVYSRYETRVDAALLVPLFESTEVLTIAVLKCWTSLLCFKTWKPVSHITVCVSVYVCLCVYARHQKHSWNISDQLVSSRVFFFLFLFIHAFILDLLCVNNHEHILFPRPILH